MARLFSLDIQSNLEIKSGSNLSKPRTADGVGYSAKVGCVLQVNIRRSEVDGVEKIENV